MLEYLRSGRLGSVALGARMEHVSRCFGPPDVKEGHSWRYGDFTLEFSFSGGLEYVRGIVTDPMRFAQGFELDTWHLRRGYPLTALKYYLYQEGVVFDLHITSEEIIPGDH